MNAFLWVFPSKPPPVARLGVYASNHDNAERALSPREGPRADDTAARSTPENIQLDTLSPTSTAVNSVVSGPHYLKDLPQTIHSFFQRLWKKNSVQSTDAINTLRSLEHEKVNDFPKGYPQLAAFLNSDENFSIFRKYGRTSSRVLLHLQAELEVLDKKLTDLDINDSKKETQPTTDWRLESVRCDEGWDSTQKMLIEQLQDKLVRYYDLLLKVYQIKALGRPLKHNHGYVYNWIEGMKPVSEEEDNWILHEDDLVALAPIDHLESSLANTCLNRLFHPAKHGDGTTEPVVTYFSRKRVTAAAKALSVLIAVAILIIPISILLWVSLNRAWMSVTVLLSVLIFSILLSLSTTMKAKDVFLGSAAYCAVLATFLGNLQPGASSRISSPG